MRVLYNKKINKIIFYKRGACSLFKKQLCEYGNDDCTKVCIFFEVSDNFRQTFSNIIKNDTIDLASLSPEQLIKLKGEML